MILYFTILAILFPLISHSQWSGRKPVELRSVTIESEFVGPFVKNIAEFEFYNPNNIDKLKAICRFHTNANSFVQNLWLDINDTYKIAETFSSAAGRRLYKRVTGRRLYEGVTGKRLDSALLQTSGNGDYNLRVFPFKPFESRKVKIEFYSTMDYDKGDYTWSFNTNKTTKLALHFKFNFPGRQTYYKLKEENKYKLLNTNELFESVNSSSIVSFRFLPLEKDLIISGLFDSYMWNIQGSDSIFREVLNPSWPDYKILEHIVAFTKQNKEVDASNCTWRFRGLRESFISYLKKYYGLNILLYGYGWYSRWNNDDGLWNYKNKNIIILKETLTNKSILSLYKAGFIDKFKQYNEVTDKQVSEQVLANFLTRSTSKLVLEDNERVNRIRSEELENESRSGRHYNDLPPPPIEDEHIDFFAVTHKPIIIKKAVPQYPKLAQMANVEGLVIVTILIDTTGHVKDAKIFKSVPLLDEVALEAAKKCIFKPARQRAKPVSVKMNIPFNFRLNEYEEIPKYSPKITISDTTIWVDYFDINFTSVRIDGFNVVMEKGFELEKCIRINYSSKEHFELMMENPWLIKYSIDYENLAIRVNEKWYLIL